MQKRVILWLVGLSLITAIGWLGYNWYRGRLNSSADLPATGIPVIFADKAQQKDAQLKDTVITQDGYLQLAPEVTR